MFTSILASVLLAALPLNADSNAAGVSPADGNQTLTLRASPGNTILVGGLAVTDTTLVLRNAHVASTAELGSDAYTVVLPDGRIYYKGDLAITVQSRESGTTTYKLEGGEATLATANKEVVAATDQ